MATQKQYNTNMLTPKTNVFIDGEIVFSHIGRLYEGAELEKENQRKRQWGLQTSDRPFTRIVIKNASVRPVDSNKYSTEELYVQERMYETKSEPSIKQYEGVSKGTILPTVVDNNGNQVHLQGKDLDNGLKVTLVMSVFKASPQNGFGLQCVVVNEPIRYYNGSGNAQVNSALEQLGITYKPTPAPKPEVPVNTTPDTTPTVPAPVAPTVPTPSPTQQVPPIANPTPVPTVPTPTPSVPPAVTPAPVPEPVPPAGTPVGGGVRTDGNSDIPF